MMDSVQSVLGAWSETRGVSVLITIYFLQLITPTIPTTATTDMIANAVNVSLYLVELSQWDGIKPSFTSTVVDEANTYCKSAPTECGIQSWENSRKFVTENIIYNSAYPKYEKPLLTINYALALPNVTNGYVPRATVEVISANSRGPLSSSANVEIVKIGNTNYGPVPDAVINGIICGLVVLVCLMLILLVVILNKKCGDDYVPYVEPAKKAPEKDVENVVEEECVPFKQAIV